MKFKITFKTLFSSLLFMGLGGVSASAQGPAPCTSNNAGCGSVEFTSYEVVSTATGAGTQQDPLRANSLEVKLCADIINYAETGLNYLHGVFVRNVPAGSTISNMPSATAAGMGHQPSGEQLFATPLVSDTDGDRWKYFDMDDGIPVDQYPQNTAAASGNGFIPHKGFYCVKGAADSDPRDNFGDPGQGNGQAGVTFENFELVPFCFYITLTAPTDGSVLSFTPDLGISGDGSTGQHITPQPDCFIASFIPRCGGSDNNGSVHLGAPSNDPGLALELTTFEADAASKVNNITWTTANDQDVATYELEKSATGDEFRSFDSTPAQQKATTQTYDMVDRAPAMITYYRLKAINIDGSVDYSEVISVKRNAVEDQVVVYPTMFNEELTIQSNVELGQEATIVLTDLTGKVIYQTVANMSAGQQMAVDVANVTPGIYLVTVSAGNERFYQKVIKR